MQSETLILCENRRKNLELLNRGSKQTVGDVGGQPRINLSLSVPKDQTSVYMCLLEPKDMDLFSAISAKGSDISLSAGLFIIWASKTSS